MREVGECEFVDLMPSSSSEACRISEGRWPAFSTRCLRAAASLRCRGGAEESVKVYEKPKCMLISMLSARVWWCQCRELGASAVRSLSQKVAHAVVMSENI